MVNFLLQKIFRGNLNEAISLAEIDVTLKETYILTNEIPSVRFPSKIFLKRKLIFTQPKILFILHVRVPNKISFTVSTKL